jgi:hypothetical protein
VSDGLSSPELLRAYRELADGQWHPGVRVLRAIALSIPDGPASRVMPAWVKTHRVSDRRAVEIASMTHAELIEAGREHQAWQTLWGAVRRSRLEADVPLLDMRHRQGLVEWHIRDTEARLLSIADVAADLGVNESVVRTWIDAEHVPPTVKNRGGVTRIPEEHLPIYRKVRSVYRKGAMRWAVNPRSLWDATALEADALAPAGHTCPSCGAGLDIRISALP